MTASESAVAWTAAGRRLRVALGGSTLLMVGLSWPIWVGHGTMPAVPFVAGWPLLRPPWSWLPFGAFVGAVATSVGHGFSARARPRLGAMLDVLALAGLVALVLGDQNRFQPWVYQFGMMSLALAVVPPSAAIRLCRYFVIALYFHSGLSKLDASFCRELGLTFLDTALRPFGLRPETWPAGWTTAAVLVMPAAEIAIAIGLLLPRTRRYALGAAVGLHLALIGILGPWGLRQSAIVLVWNAALIVADVILFGFQDDSGEGTQADWRAAIVTVAFLVAAVMPLGERVGIWDTWPSFALYASHAERTDIFLHEDELPGYPPALRRHVSPRSTGPWHRLDLTAWSRAERGVPPYPQGRTANGIAEALAGWNGRPKLIWVRQWGRADRWTGRRKVTDLFGAGAVRRWGDTCRLNAHPARAGWPVPAARL